MQKMSVCLCLRVVGERAGTLATARARGEGHRHACPCCRQLQRNCHSGTIHQQLAAIPPSKSSAGAEASRARGAGRPGWIVSSCLRLPTLQQAGAAWVRRMAYTMTHHQRCGSGMGAAAASCAMAGCCIGLRHMAALRIFTSHNQRVQVDELHLWYTTKRRRPR